MDVCALCVEQASEHGWIKEGSPTTPLVAGSAPRRKRFGGLGALFEPKQAEPEPVVSEPVLRRLNPEEQTLVEAAELFNGSPYSRTIAGIAKSLGEGRISMLQLTGSSTEIVLTIAWDISWYQYRIIPESSAAGPPGRARATRSARCRTASRPGTRTSTSTAASCRTSRASSLAVEVAAERTTMRPR